MHAPTKGATLSISERQAMSPLSFIQLTEFTSPVSSAHTQEPTRRPPRPKLQKGSWLTKPFQKAALISACPLVRAPKEKRCITKSRSASAYPSVRSSRKLLASSCLFHLDCFNSRLGNTNTKNFGEGKSDGAKRANWGVSSAIQFSLLLSPFFS